MIQVCLQYVILLLGDSLRYVEITQKDLQREFSLARQSVRHLIPLPASVAAADPDSVDATAVVERLSSAIRVLDIYRQQINSNDKPLQLLLRPSFASARDFKKWQRARKTKNRLRLARFVTLRSLPTIELHTVGRLKS